MKHRGKRRLVAGLSFRLRLSYPKDLAPAPPPWPLAFAPSTGSGVGGRGAVVVSEDAPSIRGTVCVIIAAEQQIHGRYPGHVIQPPRSRLCDGETLSCAPPIVRVPHARLIHGGLEALVLIRKVGDGPAGCDVTPRHGLQAHIDALALAVRASEVANGAVVGGALGRVVVKNRRAPEVDLAEVVVQSHAHPMEGADTPFVRRCQR
mmetsp:Transcript_6861/g.11323  ORF Transcript_6861/g.11323 Transcript_6861/m.11323 type:complete len:205 (-) Transcript_6861:560-1174(-)